MLRYRLRTLLIVLILAGLGLVAVGPLDNAIRPYSMLDVVLTPGELRDDAIRERTLEKLKKETQDIDRTPLHFGGIALITAGALGLFAQMIGAQRIKPPATLNQA